MDIRHIFDNFINWNTVYKLFGPFWQKYINGINLTVIHCDPVNDDCEIKRKDNWLTMIVKRDEVNKL